MFLFFFLFIFLIVSDASAQTGLPVPRFVSLRSKPVNLRTGPGTQYPVEWVYMKSGLPVEIIAEFGTWRQIRDFNKQEGWIHQQMLSGRRTIRPLTDSFLLRAANVGSLPLAKIEAGALGRLISCPKGLTLCKAEFEGFQGWISKKTLWGVYPDEVFE